MKDYIIWLKSGECITGSAKEKTIKSLQTRFKNNVEEKEKISFADENGTVVLDISRIDAISINKQYDNKPLGFCKS